MMFTPPNSMDVSTGIIQSVVDKAKALSVTTDQHYLHTYFNINTGEVVFKIGTESGDYTVTISVLSEFNFNAFEYIYHKIDQTLLSSNIQVLSYQLINRDEDEFSA